MSRALVFLTLGSLLATSALATTYVRTEKDGTKTYSDRPMPGGVPVDLRPAQTYSTPTPSSTDTGSRPQEEQELLNSLNFQYSSCSLSPKNDQTFTNPTEVAVSLLLTPNLRFGDSVTISVDGSARQGSTTFSLPQPDRGSHTVSAQVTDRSGKTVCSASTTFHVQRPNLNSPARVPPRPPPRPNPPRPTPH